MTSATERQTRGLILPKNAPPAFHVLIKPTGAICNLDCKYCFFLSKEMLYPGSRFQMAEDLLETYLKQLMESHRAPEVVVSWQGGEPTLMGLDFFKRSIELVNKLKHPGQQIQYTIQTNGTLLDDEWCAFFKQNNFLVGLSVDGPKDLHDVYRVNKGGTGSFDQVMRGLDALKRHKVDVNILCTVHAASIFRLRHGANWQVQYRQSRVLSAGSVAVRRRLPGLWPTRNDAAARRTGPYLPGGHLKRRWGLIYQTKPTSTLFAIKSRSKWQPPCACRCEWRTPGRGLSLSRQRPLKRPIRLGPVAV